MASSRVKSKVGRTGQPLDYRLEEKAMGNMPPSARMAHMYVKDTYGPDILQLKPPSWDPTTVVTTLGKFRQEDSDLHIETSTGPKHVTARDHLKTKHATVHMGSILSTIAFSKEELPGSWDCNTTIDRKHIADSMEKFTLRSSKASMAKTTSIGKGYVRPQTRERLKMEATRETKKQAREELQQLEQTFGKEGAEMLLRSRGMPLKTWQRAKVTKEDLQAVAELDDFKPVQPVMA